MLFQIVDILWGRINPKVVSIGISCRIKFTFIYIQGEGQFARTHIHVQALTIPIVNSVGFHFHLMNDLANIYPSLLVGMDSYLALCQRRRLIQMSKSFGYTGLVWITFVFGIIQLPFHFLALQRLSPIIGDLNLRLHRVILLIAEFVCHQQRHHRRAPLAPFLGRSDSLTPHKRIEDAYESTSLTGIILNIEQLEARHILGAKIHFYIGFIEFHAP